MPGYSVDEKYADVTDETLSDLKAAFVNWDKDGNGTLSFPEMKDLLQRGNPLLPEKDLRRMYREVDRNQDGRVDFGELLKWLYGIEEEKPQPQPILPPRKGSRLDSRTSRDERKSSVASLPMPISPAGATPATSRAQTPTTYLPAPSRASARTETASSFGSKRASKARLSTRLSVAQKKPDAEAAAAPHSSAVPPLQEQKYSAALMSHAKDFVKGSGPGIGDKQRRSRADSITELPAQPAAVSCSACSSNTTSDFTSAVASGQFEKVNLNCERDAQLQDVHKLWELAQQLNLPLEVMCTSYGLFKTHAQTPAKEESIVDNGRLTRTGLTSLLAELFKKDKRDVSETTLKDIMKLAMKDPIRGLVFSEFALWLASASFDEELNLDDEQRQLRVLARKHNVDAVLVDKYERNFRNFDSDGSGDISRSEFEHLLSICARVPKGTGLPPARVQDLWRMADADGSGEIDFEEFIMFYMRWFDMTDSQKAGFEDYYRNIRRHGQIMSQRR